MKSKTENTPSRVITSFQLGIWALVMTSVVLGACTRTITTRKRSYSIAGSEQDDSGKMRERYASGFRVGEDGSMQTDKKNLYEDHLFRNAKDNEKDMKDYRIRKKDFDLKEYRTPEYLTRQKDFQTKDSKFYKEARESDVDRFTTGIDDEEAWIKKNKPGFLDWLNPFSKRKDYWDSDKNYRTSTNRAGSRAVERAPSPVPMGQIGASPQDQRNTSLSMDDVKKMVNPKAYSSLRK